MQTDLYRVLMASAAGGHCDGFDAHVLACGLAIAAGPAAESLIIGTGLERAQLLAVLHDVFPGLERSLERVLPHEVIPAPTADESCLKELLSRHGSGSRISLAMAALVARRAMQPNHLWQDLGLRNRRELSWLMERHFPVLATRNRQDMKWKKYLYRTICRDEGFGLCPAPVCDECTDFNQCFGEEQGAQLLSRSDDSLEALS